MSVWVQQPWNFHRLHHNQKQRNPLTRCYHKFFSFQPQQLCFSFPTGCLRDQYPYRNLSHRSHLHLNLLKTQSQIQFSLKELKILELWSERETVRWKLVSFSRLPSILVFSASFCLPATFRFLISPYLGTVATVLRLMLKTWGNSKAFPDSSSSINQMYQWGVYQNNGRQK